MAKEKARYFTFLLYPESIPDDWEIKLELLDIPMAISPLHDKDVDKKNGGFKKPHYHVIYVAKNPVTAESVRLRIKRTLGDKSLSIVQIVRKSMENMYLYLTHESKDAVAKKKHVYPKSDIQLLSNFDISRYVTLDVEEKDYILDVVCNMIDEQGLANVRELKRFVGQRGNEYGIDSMKIINEVIRSHTGLIRLYFDAVYQERKYGGQNIDYETGEIK
ncbi:replication protein [Streptococcus phocae]|uniref:Replication protein RepB n=1 Tax=Streptococcus phocae TaxID=119224 RepID=A0A0P6S584_9STRE|nr:replication protein [Streptococcus phocae]KPJ23262.1 replication protein RepB [Streptococcus phocae]